MRSSTTRLALCVTTLTLAITVSIRSGTQAQEAEEQLDELRAGKNFIPTSVFTLEEDQEVLKLFEGSFNTPIRMPGQPY